MRLLIATNELQATTDSDYSFTVEGELVTPLVAECCTPDTCGCGRGFPGLASGKATTTAMVVDRPFITVDDLRDAVFAWLERCGWTDLLGPDHADEIEELVDEHVDVIQEVCRTYPLGTVVERQGTIIASRSYRTAA